MVAFAVLYAKKGPELRLLLTNERFGDQNLQSGDQNFLFSRQ